MTPENFTYWLQGYFELLSVTEQGDIILSAKQAMVIRDHLSLVFDKQTPNRIQKYPSILPMDFNKPVC